MVKPLSPVIPPGRKHQNMKTLNETQLHEITGGEIDPPSWESMKPSPDQQAIENFLIWYAQRTQSIYPVDSVQAD